MTKKVTMKKIGAVLFQLDILLESEDLNQLDRDELEQAHRHLRAMYDYSAYAIGAPVWGASS